MTGLECRQDNKHQYVPKAIVLAPKDFGRDVVGGAAEGRRGVPGANSLLTHPVVRQLDVALVVQQHVV